MYLIKNPRKFQLGGGRVLPGLVYNNNPALIQHLASPKPSGFNEMMQVEGLRFQHDNARRANAQLMLQDEQLFFEQEQAKIKNEQIKIQEKRLQEAHEYQKAKDGLAFAKNWKDEITGMKYNPRHQQTVTNGMMKAGILDADGNMAIDSSTVEGMNNGVKAMFNFQTSAEMRDILREAAETELVDKDLATKTDAIEKMIMDPAKSIYFNTEDLKGKLSNITKRLEDYRNNPNTQENLATIKADLNGLNIDYSDTGNKLMDASVDQALANVDLTKIKTETEMLDSKTKRMIAEGQLADMKAKQEYQKGILAVKEQLANGQITNDQAELALKQLRTEHNISGSGDNLTEAERKDQQVRRVMETYNVDELTAINKIAQAGKGEGSSTGSGGDAGRRYTNIPINKDGNIEQNNVRLPTGELWKTIKDTPVVENGDYDTYNLGYDSPNREIDYSTDKPYVEIIDTGFGDGYIETNSPKKLATIMSKSKGWNKNPAEWTEEQWDSLEVDPNTKTIRVPLSTIGVQDTSTQYSSVTEYGNDAPPMTTEFTNNTVSYLAGGMYQALQSKEEGKVAFRKAFDTYGIKFPSGNTSDGISYQESFDQMEMDTKGLAITIAPLLNGTNATFTSGKRYKNNADQGHGAGKGFDIQLGRQEGDTTAQWYADHMNWMDYVAKSLVNTSDPTVGKITKAPRASDNGGIRDTYFVHDAKTQGYYSFSVYLHPSVGTGTPHLDFKVREVKRGMKRK